MKPEDLADLFGALAAAPRLPGAACVGRHELFDSKHESDPNRAEAEAAAMKICLTECGAYSQCRDWIQSLPASRRPSGVVAGVVRRPRTKTPASRLRKSFELASDLPRGAEALGRPRKAAADSDRSEAIA
jgi:WhiB family transcriptional regulator, redox-sensing transcriptional regulator